MMRFELYFFPNDPNNQVINCVSVYHIWVQQTQIKQTVLTIEFGTYIMFWSYVG